MTSPFNSLYELPLVLRTRPRSPPGYDLPDIRRKLRELLRIFVIDIQNMIFTESADSFSTRFNQQVLLEFFLFVE